MHQIRLTNCKLYLIISYLARKLFSAAERFFIYRICSKTFLFHIGMVVYKCLIIRANLYVQYTHVGCLNLFGHILKIYSLENIPAKSGDKIVFFNPENIALVIFSARWFILVKNFIYFIRLNTLYFLIQN